MENIPKLSESQYQFLRTFYEYDMKILKITDTNVSYVFAKQNPSKCSKHELWFFLERELVKTANIAGKAAVVITPYGRGVFINLKNERGL